MFRKYLFLLLAAIPLAQPAMAKAETHIEQAFRGNETIKVLIAHDRPSAVLEVNGKYRIYDPHLNQYMTTRFMGKRKNIQALQGGLKWGEEFPGVHQLAIIPGDNRTTIAVDGVEYPGIVYIYDIGGAVSIVNELKIDDYINAVLSQKLKQDLPQEALAAFVIAGRTLALYRTLNPPTPYWAVRADWVDYQGSAAMQYNTRLAKVIADTKKMVMSREDSFREIQPFPSVWQRDSESPDGIVAQIDLNQADQLARTGKNAAQILRTAFPSSSMKLMQ